MRQRSRLPRGSIARIPVSNLAYRMQVLAAVDAHLLYSKFASKGIRPDARAFSQLRATTLLEDAAQLPHIDCSCMVRLGQTTVLAVAEVVFSPERPAHACSVAVQYPAVTSGSAASGLQEHAQMKASRLESLWQRLGVIQWTASDRAVEANLGSRPKHEVPSLHIRGVLLADDGGAFESLVAACAWCSHMALTAGDISNPQHPSHYMRMSVYPVAATVSTLATATGSGPLTLLDPSSASGEDLPRRSLQLTVGIGSSSMVATVGRVGAGKSAGTDGLGQGLGQGQVTAVVDAWSGNVLDLSVEQVRSALSSVPATAMDAAVAAAMARTAAAMGRIEQRGTEGLPEAST